MEAITIALATPADLAALPDIERAAAALFPPEDVPRAVAEGTLPAAVLEEARRGGRLWVARLAGSAVGFLAADLVDGLPFVVELDVLPALHRRGAGTALLGAAIAWARPHGSLTLTTFRHLPFNAPFYARRGFAELPAAAHGPQLRARLAGEAGQGLAPEKRVAMRLWLASAEDGSRA